MEINIEEYYKRYGPMVLRRCRALLKNEDAAYDAMQEVFVKLMQNKKRLKGTYPSSLLYRIATNICLNIIRADRSGSTTTDENLLYNIASFDDTESKTITTDLLERIFKSEKASTREIAVMHYVDGLTLEDTARETGLSVSGVRKRLRLLRERALQFQENGQ